MTPSEQPRLLCNISRFRAWRLRRAELKLADLIQYDETWVSGFGIPRPPSEIDRMKRRIAKADARVLELRRSR